MSKAIAIKPGDSNFSDKVCRAVEKKFSDTLKGKEVIDFDIRVKCKMDGIVTVESSVVEYLQDG